MKMQLLKLVPAGEFVKRKPDAKKTYVRGDYDRRYKKYRLDDWDDISRDIMLPGNTPVYVGFDF
mgnify:FL=1|jgi:hypothetical protein|tara:strand:+ start:218 stop:409 length:192 start_codon:yes stop_codon:yes gene_type:complete